MHGKTLEKSVPGRMNLEKAPHEKTQLAEAPWFEKKRLDLK